MLARATARRLAAATTLGGASVYAANDTDTGAIRFSRTLAYGALAGIDYKRASLHPPKSDERAAAMTLAHERSANRLLHVCRLHGGLYNKLGQFVSSMTHLLPEPYTRVLAACQDRAPTVAFADIRNLVEIELGAPLDHRFVEFETEPVAAASLAQVHRATTADGERVAVKVQYPALAKQVVSDTRAVRCVAWLLARAFPDYGYEWLLPEFEESISQELDFEREARNAARTAALFASEPQVHVPFVVGALSTRRVLTMEYIDGARLDDAPALATLGLRPAEVARLLSTAFTELILTHGFVHCDPHPGNLLARPMPGSTSRAQLVVLDHGMYRSLGAGFRRDYCGLWTALLTRDHHAGRAAAAALGVPAAEYDNLSLLLTFRTATSTAAAGARMSAGERARVRERLKATTAADVNAFLERLPRDLLFVMRAWALVRSLNRSLGGTSRQRFLIIGDAAARGAAADAGVLGWRRRWRRLRVQLYLRVWEAVAALMTRHLPHTRANLG